MSVRAVLIATVAVVASAVSCATAEQIPSGIDYGDNVSPSRDAGAGGSGNESGGSSGSADGGSSTAASGGASASSSGGAQTASGGASRGGSGRSEDAGPPPGGSPSAAGGKGAVDAGPACKQGEKICRSDGMCWPIAPPKGCDMDDGCTPCPAPPANGFSTCVNQACDFDCLSGFRKNTQGTGCERGTANGGTTGAGGTMGSGGRNRGGRGGTAGGGTGGGGTGGSGGQCSRNNCPDCSNILEAPCCRDDNTCGCGLLGIGALCN